MDESFAPSGAIDKTRLKALSARSDAEGLAQLAGHGALLSLSGLGIALAEGTPWLALALPLHGFVLVFLFAPLHETVHRTAFRNRRINDAVAAVCGFLLLLPPAYFRCFHFAHHRHTQDPARDPELAQPKPVSLGGYLLRVSGLPYWRERLTTTLRHLTGRVEEPFVPETQKGAVVREARVLWAVYGAVAAASLAASSGLALTYWVIPALLGQPFLRMYLLSEHTGCPQVPDMLRNSRTTRSTAALRRLAWNMPFHAEHHSYPALPFHALPAAHEFLKDRIAVQATGYMKVQREIVGALSGRARRPG